MAAGRPTKYKEEYTKQSYKLALLGATDEDLANFFEVTESTINLWKIKHKEFSESLKDGKDKADYEIANSLYERAKGSTVKKQFAFKVKTDQYKEELQTIEVKEEIPPDTNAIKFWLKNRKSQVWRDKQEIDVDVLDERSTVLEAARKRAMEESAKPEITG